MKLDLSPVLNGEVKELPFSFTQNVLDDEASVYFKGLDMTVRGDIEVKGTVRDISGYCELDCTVSLPYSTHCSRCGKETEGVCECVFQRIVSSDGSRLEDDEYIVYADRQLELDGPVYEELSISFPSKPLCKTDCKGLCPVCGQDLNEGDCGWGHKNENDNDKATL